MDKENYITFEDYLNTVTGKNISVLPTQTILDDVKKIREELGVANDGSRNI